MKKLFLAAVMSFLGQLQASAATCEVPRFRTADNQTVEGQMKVVSGKRCSLEMATGLGGIADVEITKRPRNGTAEIRGSRILYAPKKGFIGQDEFTYFRVQHDRYGNSAKRGVDMKVNVVP